jgi:phosphoglycolate phosphatase-like HAD superfamily hydrolase
MQLLAHRGLWYQPEEKNTLKALSASFDIGVGIETDIRDCDGTLVVSHDLPRASGALKFEIFLQNYVKHPTRPILALNIKADGLQAPLMAALQQHGIDHYFVFDMSVPDTLGYQRLQMPFAARISEYEPNNELAHGAAWIWLDAFHSEWFDNALIESWLEQGKRVAVVSPELHRRPHFPLWQKLKSLQDQSQVYLCTDLVFEAKEFFNADKN